MSFVGFVAVLLLLRRFFPSLWSVLLGIAGFAVLLIAVLVALILWLVFRKPKPGSPEAVKAENKQILSKGHSCLAELRRLGMRVKNMEIRSLNTRICALADKILKTLKEKPDSIPSVRQFLNYYLPALGGILTKYVRVEEGGVPPGDMVQNVVTHLGEIKTAMEKQYANLFEDMQMQTFVTQPDDAVEGFDGFNGDLTGDVAATLGVNCGMSTGRNGVMAFAANQRDEVRDLHDVAGALQASPGMKQQTFVAGFSAGAGASAGGIGYNESVAPTLKGSPGGSCMPSVLCLNDQGGSVMNCSENISGTLRAQEHGHQPLVYENHGIDSRYTGPHKVAPTMSARYGTGGNNVPLVEQEADAICIAGNIVDRQPQNGGNGLGCQDELSYTLTATDRHCIYARQRVDEFKNGEVVSTQSARQHKDATDLVVDVAGLDCRNAAENGDLCGTLQKGTSGSSLNSIHPIRNGLLIRRLTPLECERLQGFPDGWTDIPGASDSARYKALGNSVAIPCVEFIMSRIAAALL